MPNNPFLLDQTPAGGLIIPITADPGGLAGLTILGLGGPPAEVDLSPDAVNWVPASAPTTLEAGQYLRLTRTDSSPVVTTLFCTFPDGSGGSVSLGHDAQGYLTLNGEAWPDRAQFEALRARVDAQIGGGAAAGSGEVARLRASPGPNLLQQLTGTTEVREILRLRVTPVYQADLTVATEVRVQVPADATAVPAGLTSPVLVGTPTLLDSGGARWLSIPIRALLGNGAAASVLLDFGALYPVVTSTTGEGVTGQIGAEATASAQGAPIDAALGVQLLLAGPRTVVDRLAPDALPFVESPTPAGQFPDPGLEVVLGGAPYLRLRLAGQEFEMPFTAVGGGEAT